MPYVALALVVAFQVWVTVRVWRTSLYERRHKVAQTQLIWLVPALGAALSWSALVEEEKAMKPPPTMQG